MRKGSSGMITDRWRTDVRKLVTITETDQPTGTSSAIGALSIRIGSDKVSRNAPARRVKMTEQNDGLIFALLLDGKGGASALDWSGVESHWGEDIKYIYMSFFHFIKKSL